MEPYVPRRTLRRAEYVFLLRTYKAEGGVSMRRYFLREAAARKQVAYWEGRGVRVTLDRSAGKVKWIPLD